MCDNNDHGSDLVTDLSLLAIFVGTFWFFHGMIKDFTSNKLLIHTAGFTVLLFELGFVWYTAAYLYHGYKKPFFAGMPGILYAFLYIYAVVWVISLADLIHRRFNKKKKT